MPDLRAKDLAHLDMVVGQDLTLESLRLAVVPPYVMVVPFVHLPPGVLLVRQDRLDEDGIHGCMFTLRATAAGEGVLRVGFRDLRSDEELLVKTIDVSAS